MSFFDSTEREVKELAKGIQIRTFWGESILLAVVDLGPEAKMARHLHPYEQIGFVLEGKMTFQIGDLEQEVWPGKGYVIPSGVEHGAQAHDSGARVIEIFHPAREDFKY